MNSVSRREQIEAMLQDEPQDTFLRYSLAMELQKEGEHEASLARFRELMRDRPPHVPAYFMAARLLLQLQRADEARATLREGIEYARAQGDHHAASEMGELLIALGDWQE
ncbi:MAG: tetratricopeptide repeat protein [Pirellulaceae bacterium]|jgi:tetratricopeptide (TPR) repeat protein|nr:tetratricopeptide repeat protein [Pirellulaceae bacterium]